MFCSGRRPDADDVWRAVDNRSASDELNRLHAALQRESRLILGGVSEHPLAGRAPRRMRPELVVDRAR